MGEAAFTRRLEAPWLNGGERGILAHFGHPLYPDFTDEMLARRVLEFPNTNANWFTASAVTLAAAYLDPQRLAAPELHAALEGMLTRYLDLANSGDAGFWDGEKESHVIAARAALSKARGE